MRLGDEILDRSARGIAGAVSRLVSSGDLPPGSRLPTVRELARDLGVSPTTVSQAWRRLAESGLVEARGKLGTRVCEVRVRPPGSRFARLGHNDQPFSFDLSTGTPDPALLPDIGRALAAVSVRPIANSYLESPLLPALGEVLRAAWPFHVEELTVVNGALDALDRLLAVVVRFGDRVLVEDPTFPPILDLLDRHGAEAVPVPVDEGGIVPERLKQALSCHPVALVMQPRAQNPCGFSVAEGRMHELASVLEASTVLAIEDDHMGNVAWAPPVSLGAALPDRTVLIRSYSKSHGPDLRLAAVGGPADLMEKLVSRRMLGPGWTSRLLQAVLLELLTDPMSVDAVAHAREVYAERRQRLVSALRAKGVTVTGDDGINLWVGVRDEQHAMIALAAQGVAVAPGGPFTLTPLDSDHVRVTTAAVSSRQDELAEIIAAANGLPSRRRSR